MIKIKNITVAGLRGVRYKLPIPLNGKSSLLYGDNGSGKSTLADVFEWFFYDKIAHLVGEEIGRKGYEALRNIFLAEDEPGSVAMEFDSQEYNGKKVIEKKDNNLKSSHTNETDAFADYLNSTQQENLILRYKDLITFVLSSKSDKLTALSDIIGYSEVTNVRGILRAVLNRLSKEIKTKNFDNQINHQQSQILEQFGQNITSDKRFVEAVEELVRPFSLGMNIEKWEDVNDILKRIKTPDDGEAIKQETFLMKVQEGQVDLPINLDELEKHYKEYKIFFDGIVSDIEKLKKLSIEELLTAGRDLLSDESYVDSNCPLCLDEKNKDELLSGIKVRISELNEIKNEKKKLKDSQATLSRQISDTLQLLQRLSADKQIFAKGNSAIGENIEILAGEVKKYQEQIGVKVVNGSKLEDENKLIVSRNIIEKINEDCKSQLETIRGARKKDSKSDVYGKISIAGHAYTQIRQQRKEKILYEEQRDAVGAIYGQFLEKQKESLEVFLGNFSTKIDEIYQFLNPGEKIENIKLVPVTKDDELVGITIQFDFLNSKDVTPPHKFLSESHLNCLGLAFFLSSVEAFNRKNRFFVLDDVVSSFDANHRKRFADLLVEKYGDYQIIVLTHEKTWFDIVKNLVKGKGWAINTLKHNESKGTYIDESPQTLGERIEQKISSGDENNLGNEARKYLEHLLKIIALNLDVKVSYRFNDVNEDRMAYELLVELKGTLDKRKCTEIVSSPIISRLLGSIFIGNKDSHDSSTEPKFGDMKAFWIDVKEFENLFFCEICKSPLSLKNYDKFNKKIRCNKGELEYSWIK
jgi:wobble nucleotide-excising tRNase